jgi:enoyl-CoA hydratase/carnithine racemase
VLTGDDRAFCGGADLREYLHASTVEIAQRNLPALWAAISGCPKPLIAAVNGYALGGGCELAMQADIIVAGESARFGQPEVKVGLMPGAGATQRLTRAIGKARAMKLLLTGDMISAAEAFSFGLVSTVVPDTETLPAALELARRIADLPPLAIRQIKELTIESMNSSLEAGLRLEAKAFQLLFSSEDKTEGISAFLEKRPPVFRGR